MTIKTLCSDMLLLAVFMLMGFFIREYIKLLQKLFLPASLIGGLLILLLGQQVLGVVTVPDSYSGIPNVLIDIVMASLVFGVSFNRDKIFSYLDYVCVPMTAYGLQMCLGTGLGYLLSQIWPGLPKGWGIMGVFSFHGGHGTAGAAAATFEELGVEGNMAVGMVLSTFGLIMAMMVGMVLVNYGVRKGWATYVKEPKAQPSWFYGGTLPEENRKPTGHTVTTGISINHLALQTCWLLCALFVGRQLFSFIGNFWSEIKVLPSVLHGVIGGAVLWKVLEILKLDRFVDIKTIKLISGFLLELVVFTAMATLDVEFISTYIAPLLIYTFTLCAVTVPCVLITAKKFCKHEWFEKAMMAFGAATGNTSTGLALVRAVDPDSNSSAGDTHGVYTTLTCWKDSFVGLAPMWLMTGIGLTMGVGAALMVGFAAVGFGYFARKKQQA